MPTSFICEHSAEFVLVPEFARILSRDQRHVTPIYFWSSREGCRISRECDRGEPIRVVAMYARRPKISDPGQDQILVKFNRELFLHARRLRDVDIPVFAGVPRVSTIMDLCIGAPCSWFEINGDDSAPEGEECTLDVQSGAVTSSSSQRSWVPATEEHIDRIVASSTCQMPWSDAIERIRFSRAPQDSLGWSSRLGSYKPVYFCVVDG